MKEKVKREQAKEEHISNQAPIQCGIHGCYQPGSALSRGAVARIRDTPPHATARDFWLHLFIKEKVENTFRRMMLYFEYRQLKRKMPLHTVDLFTQLKRSVQ